MRFLILLFTLSYYISFGQNQIVWEEKRPLSWTDYHGTPDSKSQFKAYTSSGIDFKTEMTNGVLSINVRAYFSQTDSWFKPDHRNNRLLIHEQLHFDITELYARKMRLRLSELTINPENFNTVVPALYKGLMKEMIDYQKKYDLETQHGISNEKQSEWERSVNKELENLNSYK